MSQRYQNLSIELVRAAHPRWPMARLVAQAKAEWEAAATHWMAAVLQTLRELRPRARFGCALCYPSTPHSTTCWIHRLRCLLRRYYGLPQGDLWGYRGLGRDSCRTAALTPAAMAARQRLNDQLRPLYRAGGAVYPSVYLNAGYEPAEQRVFVRRVVSPLLRHAL